MEIGVTQNLTIDSQNNSGFFLSDEKGEKVFVPKFFAQDHWETGKTANVFVYQDEGQLKGTTEQPLAEKGEFAVMQCVQTLPIGAFLDWGIIKDLFVPYKEQKGKMKEGKRYLIHVFENEKTGQITGTTKFKRNPAYDNLPFAKGDKVTLILMNETELGWNVIINKKYIGLIYASDVYKKLYPLSEETGYIKTIREDGKIDVTLQPEGYANIDVFQQKIIDKLEANYGLLPLSDKSSPEEIKDMLQMSKKNFKKAIGGLYKSKKIEILPGKILLK